MKFIDSKNLKGFILNSIDQIDILAYYLGINEMDIHQCIQDTSRKISNPLRIDKHPSVGFMTKSNTIRMKDFAREEYSGDCFHIAGLRLGLDSNEPKHFVTICKDIIDKLIVNGYQSKIWTPPTSGPNQLKIIRDPSHIDLLVRDWHSRDVKFWEQYHLSIADLNYHKVYPVFSMDIKNYHYTFRSTDPAYAYYLGMHKGERIFEIYFPNRRKSSTRFITNNKLPIKKYENLKGGDVVIVSKSVKDYMVISKIMQTVLQLPLLFLNGSPRIDNIIISSETAVLSNKLLSTIHNMYPIKIMMPDNDEVGFELGRRYKDNFDMYYTDDNEAKDVSDYVKIYGVNKTIIMLSELIHLIKNRLTTVV